MGWGGVTGVGGGLVEIGQLRRCGVALVVTLPSGIGFALPGPLPTRLARSSLSQSSTHPSIHLSIHPPTPTPTQPHSTHQPTPTTQPQPTQVALGIPVPKYWASLMARTIGHAATERLVLSGRMVKAQEALILGLVDALAPSNTQGDVLALAVQWVEAAVKLPPAARAATKWSLREAFCAEWRRYYEDEEPRYGWAAISAPAAVAAMKGVLARLSGSGGGGKGKQPAASSKL